MKAGPLSDSRRGRCLSDTYRTGHISKQGRREVRTALIACAWAAVRFSAHWSAVFHSLANRIGKQKAITAVARKLLVAIWHILTNREIDRHADVQAIARSFMRWSELHHLARSQGLRRLQFTSNSSTARCSRRWRSDTGGSPFGTWRKKRAVYFSLRICQAPAPRPRIDLHSQGVYPFCDESFTLHRSPLCGRLRAPDSICPERFWPLFSPACPQPDFSRVYLRWTASRHSPFRERQGIIES
jgi:hypothetical protein